MSESPFGVEPQDNPRPNPSDAGYLVIGLILGGLIVYLWASYKGLPSMGTTYSATPVIVQQPGYYNPFYPGSQPIPPGHIIPL